MSSSRARTTNRLLWAAQIAVALLFIFAGSMKFIMPAAKLQQGPLVLPIAFIHFIGVCECLGALGLVVPGVLRFQTWLTPLAAAGLTIIMIGATVVTVLAMGAAAAILPAVVGTITVVIALGRRDRRDAGTSLRSLALAASHIPRRVI
ncbi:MAG TPA: DoxX family protein [Gemmatimonadaceae bacterium]|nr:DoxX family protein [Gemmatimonadaceae bacterium]